MTQSIVHGAYTLTVVLLSAPMSSCYGAHTCTRVSPSPFLPPLPLHVIWGLEIKFSSHKVLHYLTKKLYIYQSLSFFISLFMEFIIFFYLLIQQSVRFNILFLGAQIPLLLGTKFVYTQAFLSQGFVDLASRIPFFFYKKINKKMKYCK